MTKRIRRYLADDVLRACRGALRTFLLCLVFMASMTTDGVMAQPADPKNDGSGAPKLHPDEKPTFWLVDENGSWRAPLPNWSLEDVMRIVDSRDETQSVTPWSIQSVDAVGDVIGGIARLQISMEMSVAEGVVRAPLGLSEGVYIPTREEEESGAAARGGFTYDGPGLCVLDVDRKTGEYVAIFQSPFSSVKKDEKQEQKNESRESVESKDAEVDESPENVEGADPSESSREAGQGAAASNARDSHETGRLRPYSYRLNLDLSFTVETSGQNGDRRPANDVSNGEGLSDEPEYRLVATFPPSLHSQLTLNVRAADLTIASVKGAAADAPMTMSEDDDENKWSELKLRGLGRGGERVEFSWRRDPRLNKNPTEGAVDDHEGNVVYQVEDATIVVELDPLGTTYDATLPIRAFGGESDVFSVMLPPDAELSSEGVVAVDSNGNSIEVVQAGIVEEEGTESETAGASKETGRRMVEVKLAQRTSLVTLRLKARALVKDALVSAEQKRAPRHIAGFEVKKAQKQFGQIHIVKSQNADFNVLPNYGASGALENSPDDGADVYSFFSQPFLMTVEESVREKVVDVRPEYLTTVDCDELKLRARYLYSVYGSKLHELRMSLNGWRLSRVYDSENVINQEGVVPSNDRGEAVFPLATPSDGEILVELEFVHDVDHEHDSYGSSLTDSERSSCSVAFPTPIAARVEPAAVVILPQNAVELTPNEELTTGLVKKATRSFSINLEIPPEARQTPLYYQTRLAGENIPAPFFVADIKRLQQQIWVNVKTDATISDKGLFHVNETFEYRIEHEPTGVLEFQALTRLVEGLRDRGVKCFVDGRQQNLEIDPPEVSDSDEAEDVTAETDESARAGQPVKSRYSNGRIVVEPPRIGSCVVTLQYDLDPIEIREGLTNQVRVDLFQPKLSQSSWNNVTNELVLSAPVGLGLSFSKPSKRRASDVSADVGDAGQQSFWNVDSREFSDDGKMESIHCASLVAELSARFSLALDPHERGLTIVDRAWVQSWFSGTARVDRIVWKMICDRDYVELRLPERCNSDRVSVSIDGEPLPVGGDARHGLVFHEHKVRIPIDPKRQRKEIALEVSYMIVNDAGTKGFLSVEFPDFTVDSVWIRRVYWQTIFNRNRLIVIDPHEWTPEFVVKRGSGSPFYRRAPTMTQDDLCDWIGIARREAIPQEANVYLYSRFCESPVSSDVLTSGEVREERALPNARLLVVNNAFVVFLGSGLVLALGLGLVYLQVMSARQAFFTRWALLILCGLALILASLRPLLALLFLQTTTFGVLLTLTTAALTAWLGRSDSKNNVGETKNASEKGA